MPKSLLGNYNGEPTAPVTPLAGIRRKLGPRTKVLYARGSDLAANMPLFEVIPTSRCSLERPTASPASRASTSTPPISTASATARAS